MFIIKQRSAAYIGMAYIVMAYIGTVQKGMAFGMLREALGGVEGGGVVDAVQCDGHSSALMGTINT